MYDLELRFHRRCKDAGTSHPCLTTSKHFSHFFVRFSHKYLEELTGCEIICGAPKNLAVKG